MCLAVVALDAHPRYAVVVAANRDEFHARPTLPATWGTAPPFVNIVAGRDLKAGGTWFGVHRDGRWALVTNVREPSAPDARAHSRGELVPRILNAAASPAAALDHVLATRDQYNGFNLLCGNATELAWASNRSPAAIKVARGIHGLSNAALDTPWPKVVQLRDALAAWTRAGADEFEPLFAALADRTLAQDHVLPATGVTLERERQLSAAFIVGERYGTRCSTVYALDRDGHARFHERSFDPDGCVTGNVVITFDGAAGRG
jgi:uncharacterized protein with NRDE domain